MGQYPPCEGSSIPRTRHNKERGQDISNCGSGIKHIMALTKSKVFPFIVTALGASIATLVLSQLQLSVWIEPSQSSSDTPIIEVDQPNPSPTSGGSPTGSPPVNSASPVPSSTATSQPSSAGPNALRVSNRTTTPLRVVLLPYASPTAAPPTESSPQDREPVHWDFAPQEGSQQGLLLSLPDGDLHLHPGDVLMAFSLDGSRKYWGPYVVGDTALPTKQTSSASWELVLEP